MLGLEFNSFTDPEAQGESATYLDYDSKPKFILKTWLGENKYKIISEMIVTDEEWDRLKSLNEPLEDRVVECYKDTNKEWRFMRFRDDKTDGNHESIYHKVLSSIEDGVSKEELLKACPKIRENWKQREQGRRDGKRREHEAMKREEVGKAKLQRPPPQEHERDIKRLKSHPS